MCVGEMATHWPLRWLTPSLCAGVTWESSYLDPVWSLTSIWQWAGTHSTSASASSCPKLGVWASGSLLATARIPGYVLVLGAVCLYPWIHLIACPQPNPYPLPLIEEDPDAGKDWGQEEKGATEDGMVGWPHWLNGHEIEQTLGHSERQGRLVCHSP